MYKCSNCGYNLHHYENICPSCWRCQICKQRTKQETYICLFCDLQQKYCPLLDSLISRKALGCAYCSGSKICPEHIPDSYIEKYDKNNKIPWGIAIILNILAIAYIIYTLL